MNLPTTSRESRQAAGASRRDLGIQLALVVGAAVLYFAVRAVTKADVGIAIAHGNDVLDFESAIGLDAESTMQSWVLPRRWLVTAFNWIYIWLHWPVITITLIWLQRTRRPEYLLVRNALFISGAMALVIFALYPVAPPRLLDGDLLLDTVGEYSTSYRLLQPPSLVNKYAALPSLHVGWNLLVGIALWRSAKTRLVRALGAISPTLMVAAVVLTANHYIVDAIAGAALAMVGLAIAKLAPARATISAECDQRHGCRSTWRRGRIEPEGPRSSGPEAPGQPSAVIECSFSEKSDPDCDEFCIAR